MRGKRPDPAKPTTQTHMPKIHLDIELVRLLPRTHSATIPGDYLDDMGHMNVMWYTHLFSMAMGGMFQLIGLTQEHVQQRHGGSFALESHIRYLSEVRVGHSIQVHTRLLGRTSKRYHLLHVMINDQKRDVAATFEAVGAYIDMRTRRMAEFPPDITQPLDRFIAEHQQLAWPAPVCGIMHP